MTSKSIKKLLENWDLVSWKEYLRAIKDTNDFQRFISVFEQIRTMELETKSTEDIEVKIYKVNEPSPEQAAHILKGSSCGNN